MCVSLFENKPQCCPFGHQLWPGKAQVSWTPCICGALAGLQRFILAHLDDAEAIVMLDETAELKKEP